MRSLFLDTSVLAKRYVDEAGSEWVANLFTTDTEPLVYSAEITVVELTSAIVRRSKGGTISPDELTNAISEFDRHLIRDYYVLEIDSNLLIDARLLVSKHGLRAYDAVQLAVGQKLNLSQIEGNRPALTFVSADSELLFAADCDGLLIEDPTVHC